MQTAISDYNHLAHVRVLRQIQTFVCQCTVIALFYFEVQAPRGLYSEGRFNGGIFALRVQGAYIWRGLFSEFYGIYFVQPVENIKNIYREGYKQSEQFVKNKVRLLRGQGTTSISNHRTDKNSKVLSASYYPASRGQGHPTTISS